jgi:divalent metal cation (Fe/Co/Zn/Cd) transporter
VGVVEGYTQRDPENLRGLRLALGVYASSLFAPRLAVCFATGVMALLAEALHTLGDTLISGFLRYPGRETDDRKGQ